MINQYNFTDMKRIFSFLLALVLVSGSLFALPVRHKKMVLPVAKKHAAYEEPTIIMSPESIGNNIQYTFTQENIKVECTKGAQTDTYFGCNADQSITFTATEPIVSLSINGYVKQNFEATVSAGTIESVDASDGVVEANPVVVVKNINNKTITVNCVKQLRCYSVSFYFESNTADEIGGDGGNSDGEESAVDVSRFTKAMIEYYESEEGYYDNMIYIADPASDDYIAFNFYTDDFDFAGTYTFDGENLDSEYSSIYLQGETEEDYEEILFSAATLTITKNKDNTYTIVYNVTTAGGNTYTNTITDVVPVFDGRHPYEPIQAQADINLTLPNVNIYTDYIEYAGAVYMSVYDGDEENEPSNELSLCFLTSDAAFSSFEDGTYSIENTTDDGKFVVGYYSYFGMDGCLLFLYDKDEVYYINEGTVTFATTDGVTTMTLNGTSYFGTKITVTCSFTPGATGIDTVSADNDAAVKIMRGNEILIRRGGKTYNLQGIAVE